MPKVALWYKPPKKLAAITEGDARKPPVTSARKRVPTPGKAFLGTAAARRSSSYRCGWTHLPPKPPMTASDSA